MADQPDPGPRSKRRKMRVAFRRNRSRPGRMKDWTRRHHQSESGDIEVQDRESIRPKGELSRKRTIIEGEPTDAELLTGVVIEIHGRFCDVDHRGSRWLCEMRRVLKTRRIAERSPLTVGDRVRFRVASAPTGRMPGEGLIEIVEPRRSELSRRSGQRVHTIAANVDQVIIVMSAGLPPPKPHLVDRYLLATLKGGMTPIICLNKIDLDPDPADLLTRYDALGYATVAVSAVTGENIEVLRCLLKDRSSVFVGQSGVGKSALLNAIEPGLRLRVGELDRRFSKGRHTTTTAVLLPLSMGGYVVDTPGIRTMDVTLVARHELESLFVEFVDRVPHCKFPDCAHIHETGCAIIAAVEAGEIHPERYESYVRLYTDPAYEPTYD